MLVSSATQDMVTVEPARNGEPPEPFKLRNPDEWTKLTRHTTLSQASSKHFSTIETKKVQPEEEKARAT